MKVSVIMPFVNEWPQIAFTIRAIKEEFQDRCDYEIICIDNYCAEVALQGAKPDRGHDHYVLNKVNKGLYPDKPVKDKATFQVGHIMAQSRVNGSWLKCFKFDKKLSHWNAKNFGVSKATGDILLFLDAHVMPSRGLLFDAALQYTAFLHKVGLQTTLHLPLSYHILENKRLMYKMIYEPEKGNLHYSFTNMIQAGELFEVPCMSTCGMFMHKKFFESINGWPEGMGIYGGGENYINYLMAILGARKFIYPFGCLHHHGDKRDYSWNWTDYHRNRMIATCLFGGEDMLAKYEKAIGNNKTTAMMMRQAYSACAKHMAGMSCDDPQVSIEEFVEKWKGCRAIGYKTGKRYE